ncbi:hypothetical protein BAE44_0004229 [Dichanthelium oligosanthes]|uniref:Uncharacterized protein n=1 Tax=Dichanthelium oligosanthes TaxID=888268 RepID=A0A1E5WBJ0_9POAL|nr:hypothetical protein BAE44_0004229 [Dichanthelium oligosanthes]
MADAPAACSVTATTKCYKSARCTTALSALHQLPGPVVVSPDQLIRSSWICSTEKLSDSSDDMEIERLMECQIPAFGVWNYCNDLSITQYFDSAMQARLMKRWNHRRGDRDGVVAAIEKGVACGEQFVLFTTPSFQRKPAQTKVIRREAEKHCSSDELQDGGVVQAEVGAYPMKRKIVSKPVDEDLYKVPQPLLHRKPRKVRAKCRL